MISYAYADEAFCEIKFTLLQFIMLRLKKSFAHFVLLTLCLCFDAFIVRFGHFQ